MTKELEESTKKVFDYIDSIQDIFKNLSNTIYTIHSQVDKIGRTSPPSPEELSDIFDLREVAPKQAYTVVERLSELENDVTLIEKSLYDIKLLLDTFL